MTIKSLDPRVNRLQISSKSDELEKSRLDQLQTYEVFVQPKENRPYQHEGIVHASDSEMAFIFAKEQFSRRSTCTGIKIIKTQDLTVTEMTENGNSVYDSIIEPTTESGPENEYLIFHLMKRGKQHKMAGEVLATSIDQALHKAKLNFHDPDKPVLNIWVCKRNDVLTVTGPEKVIWETLPEKSFREAIAYRGADKIKKFLEENAK